MRPNFFLREEDIREGMTSGIGINTCQAKVLGVYPLHKGWIRKLIGKEISDVEYSIFLALTDLDTSESKRIYAEALPLLRQHAKICKHI